MRNLQDLLSITPYDVSIICFELLYVIFMTVFFIRSANIIFDIDLARLRNEYHNMYIYSVLSVMAISFVLISGVISHESQESVLSELVSLMLYSALGLISILIKKVSSSAGKYGQQIISQLYAGNIAAFIHHVSQIFCTTLIASFAIRSFYGENMAYIMFIIIVSEIAIGVVLQIYGAIFNKQYGMTIEYAIIRKDWHVALQAMTFRLLASISICASTMLVLIVQNRFLLSVCVLLLTSAIMMTLTLVFVTVMNKLFFRKGLSIYLIDPAQNGAYCIQHFLIYATVCIFITYIVT